MKHNSLKHSAFFKPWIAFLFMFTLWAGLLPPGFSLSLRAESGTLTPVGIKYGNYENGHLLPSLGSESKKISLLFQISPAPASDENFSFTGSLMTNPIVTWDADKKVAAVSGDFVPPADTKPVSVSLQQGDSVWTGSVNPVEYMAPGGAASLINYELSEKKKDAAGNETFVPVERLTAGMKVTLKLNVQDLSTSLIGLRGAVTDGSWYATPGTAFSGVTSVTPDLLNAVPVSNQGGVIYTIIFNDITYTGSTSDLALNIRYGGRIPMQRVSEIINEAVVSESSAASGILSDGPPESMPEPAEEGSKPERGEEPSSSTVSIAVPPPTPSIIVSEYSYGGGSVQAGTDVALDFKFQNTSDRVTIENIVMKITMPEAFAIKNSANTFYFPILKAKDKERQQLLFSVKPSVEPISYPIKIAFAFETVIDKERKQGTADVEISVPVMQRDRVTLQPVTVQESFIMEQEEVSFDAKFINMGKTQIFNATLTMIGENLKNSGTTVYIGNVDSGKESTGNFTIQASEAGDISGEVVLSYEDAGMNIAELRTPFFIKAEAPPEPEPPMDMPMGDMPMMDETMTAETTPWYARFPWYYYAIAALVLIVIIAYVRKLIRSYQEKKLAKMDADF